MAEVVNKKEKEYTKNGLRILARIIIRKYINENMKEEGDGKNEKHHSRKLICNQ